MAGLTEDIVPDHRNEAWLDHLSTRQPRNDQSNPPPSFPPTLRTRSCRSPRWYRKRDRVSYTPLDNVLCSPNWPRIESWRTWSDVGGFPCRKPDRWPRLGDRNREERIRIGDKISAAWTSTLWFSGRIFPCCRKDSTRTGRERNSYRILLRWRTSRNTLPDNRMQK